MARPSPRIAVVGSLNIDHVARVETLPRPGETVAARSHATCFGGKGANQAIALARQGASVRFIGRVGRDAAGSDYLRRLAREGIDPRGVSRTQGVPTGSAFIAVDRRGENTIVVADGANGRVNARTIERQGGAIRTAAMLVAQFEVPRAAVVKALEIAEDARVPVLLNPAPFLPGFPWGKHAVEWLVVNEREACGLFGTRALAIDVDRAARVVRAWSAAHRVSHVVITRGARPVRCIDAAANMEIPAMRVRPVDTVGAGDAFVGTLAAWLAAGAEPDRALRAATCAGALTTLGRGAQDPIPSRARVERTLQRAVMRNV